MSKTKSGKDIEVLKHASLNEIPITGRNDTLNDFSVYRFQFEQQEKSVYDQMRHNFRSDFFSVIKIISGSLTVSIDFKKATVPAGSLFLFSPNTIKQLIDVSPGCAIEGLSFTSDFISRLRMHENILGLIEFFTSRYDWVWSLNKQESRVISQVFKTLGKRVALLPGYTFGQELLSISFAEFLYELAEIGKKKINRSFGHNRKEELVIRFTELARAKHLIEKNLSYYSKQLHISAKHLSETAKEITGKTAGQLIDELDFIEAKRLLEDTDMRISEIAYRLQFSNPAFFSRFFSRLSGKSPRAYRAALG